MKNPKKRALLAALLVTASLGTLGSVYAENIPNGTDFTSQYGTTGYQSKSNYDDDRKTYEMPYTDISVAAENDKGAIWNGVLAASRKTDVVIGNDTTNSVQISGSANGAMDGVIRTGYNYGAENAGTLTVSGKKINVTGTSSTSYSRAVSVAYAGGKITVGNENTADLTISATGQTNAWDFYVADTGTSIQANGKAIKATAESTGDSDAYYDSYAPAAVVNADYGNVTLGTDAATEKITLDAKANKAKAVGIFSHRGNAKVQLNGKNISVSAESVNDTARTISTQYRGNVSTSSNADNVTLTATSTNGTIAEAADVEVNGSANIYGKNITLTANAPKGAAYSAFATTFNGNQVQNGTAALTVGDANTQNIEMNASGQGQNFGAAAYGEKATTTVNGSKNLKFTATSTGNNNNATDITASGVYAGVGGTVTIGDTAKPEMITVTSKSASGDAQGVTAAEKGQVTVNGGTLNIEARNGLWAQNNDDSTYNKDGAASITVNTDNTNITADQDNGSAITAFSGSTVTVTNSLTASGKDAIMTRGRSTVNINQDGKGTVKLDGDIEFNSGEKETSSGTFAGSKVNLNLNNSDSYLNGSTKVTGYKDEANNTPLKSDLANDETGLNLKVELSNGAKWMAAEDSFANELNVSNGATADFDKTLLVVNQLNVATNAAVKANTVTAANGANVTVGDTASLTAKELNLDTNSKLDVNGDVNVSDTADVKGEVDVNDGGSLTANKLKARSGATVKSTEGAAVTLTDAELEGGATVDLQGTTTVYNSLTNNAEGTISNLVLGTPTVSLQGTQKVTINNIPLTGQVPFDENTPYRTVTGEYADISNATVDVSGLEITGAEGSLRAGQTAQMTLLDNNTGNALGDLKGAKEQNFTSGTTLQGTGIASKDGNDVVYKINVSSQAQPQTHQAVMAQTAGLTTVFGGFDTLARAADTMEGSGITAFASVGGGEHKYDTGSHIKTNAWHGLAGVGVKNGGTEYGVFYDYGDGHYRTYADGRGDGKAIYKGGGLFGKYSFDSDFYVEGSFRAGRVKNTANGIFHDAAGNGYDLKTNSNYNAFHVGIGKVYTMDEKDSLDVYGKYFHTHVNGDSFNAGGHYSLDSVDSDIMRIGARWNHKNGAWTHYLGVAYEYEFDGEAKGTADGAHIESADIGGSSARFEIGTRVETGKWVIGFNADAYAGQHKGFDGAITAGLKF